MTERQDAEQFFRQFNTSQRLRPCYQSIDMRGRVAEPCSRYLFNDRIHYLDDRSLQIYQQGLKRHRGVFTIETFEAVIHAPHTLDAPQPANPAGRADEKEPAEIPDHETDVQTEQVGEQADDRLEAVDVIRFGYFKERREPRLEIVCEVEATLRGKHIKGVIRDLSISGTRIFIDGIHEAAPGDEVLVSFMGFQDVASGVDVYDVVYKVIDSAFTDTDTVLRLRREKAGPVSAFNRFVQGLVERHDPNRKLDIEDDYQTALTWYYERLYAEHSTLVPFFVGKGEQGGLYVQSVALTRDNRQLSGFFSTYTDNYNFTPLVMPERLENLQQGRRIMIAMFREQGGQDRSQRIHSASELDYPDSESFLDFVAYALGHPEHCVVSVSAGPVPVQQTSKAKIDLVMQRLRKLSTQQAQDLTGQLERLQFVGYMLDVTAEARRWLENSPRDASAESLVAWVGTERRDLASGDVQDRVELEQQLLNPVVIRYGYVERRRENRYLAKTAVELLVREERHTGMTVDLSWHGLRVVLPEAVDVKQGAMLKVGFPSMQKKRDNLDLMNMTYRIVNYTQHEGTVLMLERLVDSHNAELDAFFDELIKRNRQKLQVDTGDVVSATAARVFESIQAVNTTGISFFLGHDREKGACLQFVAIPPEANELADFCQCDGQFVPACLFSRKMVKALYDAVHLHARNRDSGQSAVDYFEVELIVTKQQGEAGGGCGFNISSEFDVADEEQWQALRSTAVSAGDSRLLRIVATVVQPLQDRFFDKLLEVVRNESRHRAMKLSDAIVSVVGCGDIFDITGEVRVFESAKQ